MKKLVAINVVAVLAVTLAAATGSTQGAFPSDIAGWSESTKSQQRAAGAQMLAHIQSAAKAGQASVSITKGHYRFKSPKGQGARAAHIVLDGLKNISIDFQGSTLWFETESSGIQLVGSSNVTLKNVFLDWDPVPFIQGRVTAIANNTFDVRLDPGYDEVLPGMAKGGNDWRGFIFNSSTREFKSGQDNFNVQFNWNKQANGDYRVRYRGFRAAKLANSGMQIGDSVVMLDRMGRAVRVEGSTNCTLQDFTLYASPFVAFVDSNGSGTTYRRVNILRRPGTNRLIAGNADGINASNMAKGPIIENCTLEYLGDDLVNIHGHLARVLEQQSPTKVVSTRLNYRREITTPVTLEFFDRKTMKRLGTRKATATPLKYKVTGKTMADVSHKWHSGEAAQLAMGVDANAHVLSLDQPISLSGDVIIVAEDLSTPGAIIRNNTFRGSVARGIRLQSPKARIENNKISFTGGPGLTMMGQGGFWGEGPYVHSAVVTGNTFTDTCFMDAYANERAAIVIREEGDFRANHLPHDISITNNVFVRPGGAAIIARGVDNLTITGNNVSEYYNRPPMAASGEKGIGSAIIVESAKGLVLRDNTLGTKGRYATGNPVTTLDVDAEQAFQAQGSAVGGRKANLLGQLGEWFATHLDRLLGA